MAEEESDAEAIAAAKALDDMLPPVDDFGAFEEVDKGAKALGFEGGGRQLQEGISNLLYLVMNKGIPAKDVLQMPDDMIETLYSHAYNMYNQGKYDEAEHLFRFLMLLDPTESKYAFGQAAVQHMRKDYEGAVKMYYMVSLMDPSDPMPHYHASDCYLQLKDLPSALLALEFAIDGSGSDPKYAPLVEKAETLKKALEEQLGMTGAEGETPSTGKIKKKKKMVKKKKKVRKPKASP